MERMLGEHIAFYAKQKRRLQENLNKDPWDVDLLRRQIVATQTIIDALKAFPTCQCGKQGMNTNPG